MVNPFYKFWLVIRATLFWIFFLPMLLLLATLLSLLFFAPLGVRVGVVTEVLPPTDSTPPISPSLP